MKCSVVFAEGLYDDKYTVQVIDILCEQESDENKIFRGYHIEKLSDTDAAELFNQLGNNRLVSFSIAPHEIIYHGNLHPGEVEFLKDNAHGEPELSSFVEPVGFWFKMEIQIFDQNTVDMRMFLSRAEENLFKGRKGVRASDGNVQSKIKLGEWMRIRSVGNQFLVLRFLPPNDPTKAEMLQTVIGYDQTKKVRIISNCNKENCLGAHSGADKLNEN
jgi:hypothetical protein